jgi:hypothetical protein
MENIIQHYEELFEEFKTQYKKEAVELHIKNGYGFLYNAYALFLEDLKYYGMDINDNIYNHFLQKSISCMNFI